MKKEKEINEFDMVDSISQKKDFDKLFTLTDNAAFSNCLRQIFSSLYDKNPNQLNKYQLNLYLCMNLENSGQSSGILCCLQEWFPKHLNKFVSALREIDAPKSADTIKEVINLLPKDDSWFFKSADENPEKLMSKLDSEFSDYPDGSMPLLYRSYAEKYKSKIMQIEKN